MRAILIDPQNKTITATTYDGNYKSIAPMIRAESGLFDIVRVTDNTDLYVDDEGLLVTPNPNGYFHWVAPEFDHQPLPLAGCALLMDHDDGDSADVSVTPEWVRERVRWFDGVISLR